ncbi:MAG: hypothetical protein RMI89_05015 [Gloeomargarita sp. SKYBB_i_bin120]|nr:hypothetical protein [Gloeomargarita sp. SKYG98]MCS7292323.1 hypothetical protein [Gloeomargarita sp. SKYB120]MDW8177883.1 hypothetical protein [Gloeomargarita sp. SKYBB_i_bin120]
MNEMNQGPMRFDNADDPVVVLTSGLLILSGVAALVLLALKYAY